MKNINELGSFYREMENEYREHLSVLKENMHSILDDISLIRHVLDICGKLPHLTFLAPVCETKGKPDILQTGE